MSKIPQKIINFLDKSKIKYEPIKHRTVYTAHDKAATLKVKPNIIGKTLVLKTDKDLVIALIPGNKNLDKNKFKKVVNDWLRLRPASTKVSAGKQGFGGQGEKTIKSIDFVSETIMKNKFKGIKVGAVPPFGSLFKLPTFVDRGLINQSKIIVNSGNYNWSIKINPTSFKKIVPDLVIGNFGKTKK